MDWDVDNPPYMGDEQIQSTSLFVVWQTFGMTLCVRLCYK